MIISANKLTNNFIVCYTLGMKTNNTEHEMNRSEKIAAWLKANPEVGYLNSNMYYIMRSGMMIIVPALGDSRIWK